MKIGRITFADSQIVPPDRYGPEIEMEMARIFGAHSEFVHVVVNGASELEAALLRLCDNQQCPLVVTIGGTGPGPHDIVPETTLALLDRELPGFGETVRHYSFHRGPIALLSRAVAGVRGSSLIVNLPSRPKAIRGCLKLLREAIIECIELVTGVRHKLHVEPAVLPIERIFPFFKRFRIKPDPRWD